MLNTFICILAAAAFIGREAPRFYRNKQFGAMTGHIVVVVGLATLGILLSNGVSLPNPLAAIEQIFGPFAKLCYSLLE